MVPRRMTSLVLNIGQDEAKAQQKHCVLLGEKGGETEHGILLLAEERGGGKRGRRMDGKGNGGPRRNSGEEEEEEEGTDSADDTASIMKAALHFAHSTRYLVLFLTILCLTMAMSNSVALHFTVICMYKDAADVVQLGDGSSDPPPMSDSGWEPTVPPPQSDFDRQRQHFYSNFTATVLSSSTGRNNGTPNQLMFSNTQRAVLFSAVPVGSLLGSLPITPLVLRYGMRKTFFLYGVLSMFATLFTPVSAYTHFFLLLLMRFLQGVAVAICFPASVGKVRSICQNVCNVLVFSPFGGIISEWCPLRSAGTVIALLSCHIQFGPILTMPLAGELCESRWGWPALYYIQSLLTALSFVAFFAFFRDSPRHHRNVSRRELGKISRGKSSSHSDGSARRKIPYGAMFRDPAVWGIFTCTMGTTFGFYVFVQYGPIYLNKALKFDVERTGFAVALPSLLSVLAKFIVGPASDYATILSDRSRVIFFATLSQFSMALCFCALALLPSDSPRWLLQLFFTAVTVACGINCAGVGKSAQLISRQYAPVLSTFNVFACSCTIMLIPVLVSALAPDNEPYQWSRIFLIAAAVILVCLLVFDCTAEASPRPWTKTATFAKQSTDEEDVKTDDRKGEVEETEERQTERERGTDKGTARTTDTASRAI
ncbi:hypothetical protein niasHT_014034 [Heterodera trifolii]|uniref:Major facilitator superfamily (MFS) profile domain-containing protein n=1 Tax=Heterodera trifolii TaxID=157864 RepID=A0ABD2LHN0_9BILA